MTRRSTLRSFVTLWLVAVGIGAVAWAQTPEPTTLTIGMKELPLNFDYGYDWSEAGVWVQSNIGDCLIWRDRATAAYVPWLASDYTKIDDLVWRITIRPDITFTNGEVFDAAAAKFWFDRIRGDDKMLPHRQWNFIDRVEIVDPLTIDVITVAPEPAFANKMAGTGCQVVPPAYIAEVGTEGFGQAPIGTGAYRFVEWVRDDRVVLEANPNYFRGAPAIDRLVFRAYPDDSTRTAALLTDQVDLILSPPPQDWDRITGAGNVVDRYLSNFVMHLELRAGPSSTYPEWDGPTKDPRVRQAISYAIDREIVLDVIDGLGYPTQTRVIPPMLGVHPDLYGTNGTYDPERARALLAEAGYAGEPVIIQSSTTFLLQREVTEVVASMLEEVGINVDLRISDPTSFREQVYSNYRNDEIYFFATKNSFQDAWITMLGYQSDRGERVGWTGPEAEEVDRLSRLAQVNMDPEDRAAQYERIQELILAENGGPLLTLYVMYDTMGRDPSLRWTRGPDGWLWLGDAVLD
jgi:peptide/nickel transport system substrate-binding protein